MLCMTGSSSCSLGRTVLPGNGTPLLIRLVGLYSNSKTNNCYHQDPELLNDINHDTSAFEYRVKTFPYIVNRIMNLITRLRSDAPCSKDSDCKVSLILSHVNLAQ